MAVVGWWCRVQTFSPRELTVSGTWRRLRLDNVSRVTGYSVGVMTGMIVRPVSREEPNEYYAGS